MIIIIRALSQWGKDDGDYDSPTSRDETSDFKKMGRGQRKKRPKGKKERHKKKRKRKEKKEAIKKEKDKKTKKNKKMREKERRGNATILLLHLSFKVEPWSSW